MLRAACLSLAVMISTSLPLSATAGELAVVDVQKVMAATKHWKDAVAVLEKDRVTRQTELELKQKELKARKEKIDAARAVSSPGATATSEEELMRDAQLLSQAFMQSQQGLAQLEKRATDQMLGRVETIVRELAVQGEYAFVFEAGTEEAPNVLYSNPKIDITDRVIQLYDKYFKDKPLELK